jgi:hypothetical protein
VLLGGTFLFTYFFSQGTEEALRVIKQPGTRTSSMLTNIIRMGFIIQFDQARVRVTAAVLSMTAFTWSLTNQEFAGKYRVNNLYRSRQVLLEVQRDLCISGVLWIIQGRRLVNCGNGMIPASRSPVPLRPIMLH